MRNFLLSLSILIFFNSCSSSEKEQLKVATTTWIGYSSLFYAKEKGWLDKEKIKLVHVVSLSENMYMYDAGNADAFTATQYEYHVLAQKNLH